MSVEDSVQHARALVAIDASRLDVDTSANPGRFAHVEALLVFDRTSQRFWIVGHHDVKRLDEALWQAFHVDPDDEIIGRVRVTLEAT
jgi:hypothetical protein